MKRVTSHWIHIVTILALGVLVAFSGSGCEDIHAEEVHGESSGCSAEDGHNHGAVEEHVETDEDHDCHDHEAHEAHSEENHSGHNHETNEEHAEEEEDHTGHVHEAEAGSCSGDNEDEPGLVISQRNLEAAGIELAVAESGSIEQHAQLLGEISMNNNQMFHIVPAVAGTVEEIRVQVGDQVEQGDLLAVLSSRDLAEARSEYLRARSSYSLAQTVHGNQQELFDADFLSEQDFLVSRQEYTQANIEFQSAKQSLANLGLSEYEVNRISSGSLLTRQELRAPINGTVVNLDFAPGEIVGDDVTVLTVADLSSVWVEFDVLQTDIASVRAGQTLTVSASDTSIPDATTVLDFVSPVIDRSTRTASARAELPNPHGHWMPGLYVSAHVTTSQSEVPVIVSREAVQSLDGETVVFIPDGEAFETLPVALGRSNRTHIEIEGGLRHGDRYVSKGAFALKAEIVTSGLDSHAGHGH